MEACIAAGRLEVEIGRGCLLRLLRLGVRPAKQGFVDAAAAFDAGKEPVTIKHERREPNEPKVNIIHDRHNGGRAGLVHDSVTIQD